MAHWGDSGMVRGASNIGIGGDTILARPVAQDLSRGLTRHLDSLTRNGAHARRCRSWRAKLANNGGERLGATNDPISATGHQRRFELNGWKPLSAYAPTPDFRECRLLFLTADDQSESAYTSGRQILPAGRPHRIFERTSQAPAARPRQRMRVP